MFIIHLQPESVTGSALVEGFVDARLLIEDSDNVYGTIEFGPDTDQRVITVSNYVAVVTLLFLLNVCYMFLFTTFCIFLFSDITMKSCNWIKEENKYGNMECEEHISGKACHDQ